MSAGGSLGRCGVGASGEHVLTGACRLHCLEPLVRGDVIESVEGVSRLRRWFDVFRSDALSQSESVKFMEGMAETWMP